MVKPSASPANEAPLRLETLKLYAEEIFAPIKRGESVSTIWTPMVGRRVRNKFIISYPELFKEEIGDKKYLLVYVEPLELTDESNAGYIKLIVKSVLDAAKEQTQIKLVESEFLTVGEYGEQLANLEKLVQLIVSEGFETVLFLGEFDEFTFASPVLYNNLKSIWVKSQGGLHFIFLLLEDVTTPDAIKKYGELNELLLKNVVYVQLAGEEDANYLIEYFSKELNRSFSQEEKSLLYELCGGHPFLLKSCTRIIALMNGNRLATDELKEILSSHFEPRSVAQKIFDTLTPEEQSALRELANNSATSLPSSANNLFRLGLVKTNKENKWVPFGELLSSVAKEDKGSIEVDPPIVTNELGSGNISFDPQTGAIVIGGANVEEKFTRQEYEILRFLLAEPDKLRSREEVGEAMWGKASYDKYSDWAIDQVMSKIRKKLTLLGLEKALLTVRGRGYKLALS